MRKNLILPVLVIILVVSTTPGVIGLINAPSINTPLAGVTRVEKTAPVTILALDNDETVIASSEELQIALEPTTEVDDQQISSLTELDEAIERSGDYLVVFGHSNREGIQIAENEVMWSEFSEILAQYPEKVIIIPSCYSIYLYQTDTILSKNVIAPMMKEIDYRVSIDFALLALGTFWEDDALMEKAFTQVMQKQDLISNPEETLLIIDEAYLVTETGPGYIGRINPWDIFAAEMMLDVGTSFYSALWSIINRVARGSVGTSTLAGFLFNIWELVANTAVFLGFVASNSVSSSIYCYDKKTVHDHNIWYDLIWDITITYYFWFHGVTFFTWKNTATTPNLDIMWYQRKYWNVMMEVEILKILTGSIGDFGLGLFGMKSITWHLLSSGYENVSPIGGSGGGGKDTMF
ncbi:MAG: hypothetical protein ACTSQK_00765 [Candidatus Heimdallarchaeota archaeon]